MAGSGFDADADVLRTQGRAFAEIASDFSSKSKAFGDKLKELEDGWGDDDVKVVSTLLTVYEPVSGGIVDSLEHLGEALKGIGEKLTSMAEQYDQTEQGHYQALMQAAQQHRG